MENEGKNKKIQDATHVGGIHYLTYTRIESFIIGK